MNRFWKFTRWGAAAGAAALLLNAGAAKAATPALDLCQKAIEADLESQFAGKLRKALIKCADAARVEEVKNAKAAGTGSLAKAAHTCEVQLAGIYDQAN